jgi:hypothetical protein
VYARFEQACSIEQANFESLVAVAARELLYKPCVSCSRCGVWVTDGDGVIGRICATRSSRRSYYRRSTRNSTRTTRSSRSRNTSPATCVPLALLSPSRSPPTQEISLADLFHLPSGSSLPAMGFTKLEDGSKPHVARWWKDVSSRPAWLAIKGGALGIAA